MHTLLLNGLILVLYGLWLYETMHTAIPFHLLHCLVLRGQNSRACTM